MRSVIFASLFLMMSANALADNKCFEMGEEEATVDRQNGQCPEGTYPTKAGATRAQREQGSRGSSEATACQNELRRARAAYNSSIGQLQAVLARLNTPGATVTPADQNIIDSVGKLDPSKVEQKYRGATVMPDARLVQCRSYEMTAKAVGENLASTDEKATSDGKAVCKQKAGYTADWPSCTSTVQVYNAIVALESVLLSTQSVRNAQNQQKVQTTAAQQTVDGDGQNAIYDAALADYQFKKGLGQEQLMAYTAAVAALGAKLSSWKGIKSVNCSSGGSKGGTPAEQLPEVDCKTAIETTEADRPTKEVTANNDAKQAFAGALVGFLAKAAAAKAAIDRLNMNTATVQTAKNMTNTPTGGPVFEKCVITPLDPECVQRSGRQAGQGFTQGDFSIGDGTGNNSFDLGADAGAGGGSTTPGSGSDGNGAVAGVASPFGDQVKNANKILDPASAASTSPGGAAGGGGGGVGGGLGGGGGASLGNDLKGEDKDSKQEDIKANKLAGNYNSAGGKGFSAVAGGKEENPFKSLFDEKNGGGIEEDRSIASETGNQAQPLFERITSRYKQVAADKRIEPMNLE